MTTTPTAWAYVPTKLSNLKEGNRVRITEKSDGRYVGKLIVRRITKSGKLIFWAINRSGKRAWSLTVIPGHESRYSNGSEWDVAILTSHTSDPIAADKKAVAASLSQSAMRSAVMVPAGWNFDSELAKVDAELDARAKYRFSA
jgi:hypothetical protein